MFPEVLVACLVVPAALLAAVALRRRGLQRAGGTVELSLRPARSSPGRGWVNGVGRFVGDDLRWYRVFSLSPRPRRTLSRRDLEVTARRDPRTSERHALHAGSVVMECRSTGESVELAMEPAAVTGFLSWLESRPPGATLPR
ncbi:MAG: hypothetical protein JWN88_1018 [Frankiales bacterium]|nr:hypothetical protein [Frankiales bacterium]